MFILYKFTPLRYFLTTPCNLIKKETPAQMFPRDFCGIFQKRFFAEQLQTTAFEYFELSDK